MNIGASPLQTCAACRTHVSVRKPRWPQDTSSQPPAQLQLNGCIDLHQTYHAFIPTSISPGYSLHTTAFTPHNPHPDQVQT
eukprot:1152322-Pelagomonas_calceolata.AAC.3